MKLYILGSAGWIPSKNETSCFLIEHKNQLIMLDAGTGTSNIKNHQTILGKYDTISIVLSHYHLDHLVGLIYLLPYLKGKKVNIYGPGKPTYPKRTEDYLNELLQTAFFSRPLDRFADEVYCFDYSDSSFYIGEVLVSVKKQKHSSPSFQISIDNKLVYATDTCFDISDWDKTTSGELLLHECWDIRCDNKNKHSSLENLINGINPNQFKNILLIHHNPEWNDSDYKKAFEMIKETNFSFASDGEIFEI